MSVRNTFTTEMFIETAFKVLRSKGMEKLTARSLARELHCSTMPIYSSLKSMKHLKDHLEQKAVDLLRAYEMTRRTDSAFLDMALGYVLFARNEKHLFRFLYREKGRDFRYSRSNRNLMRMAVNNLIPGMKQDPRLAKLNQQQSEKILTQMWIFTHGIAFLANSNSLAYDDDQYIEQLIIDTNRAVVADICSEAENDMKDDADSSSMLSGLIDRNTESNKNEAKMSAMKNRVRKQQK